MLQDFFTRIPPDGIDQFEVFSLTHIITAVISLGILYALILYLPKLKGHKYEKYIRYFFAISMFATNIPIWTYSYRYDMTWHEYMPIATCGWGVILGSIALLFNSDALFKVTALYGWGAILSIIVPNILEGPDNFYLYSYVYRHILIVLIPFYFIRVLGKTMVKKDFLYFFIATTVLYILGYFLSNTSPNPNEVNFFYTIEPAITGTPLTWIYNLGHFYYFVFWYAVAAYFGYLWGFMFYEDGRKKKIM